MFIERSADCVHLFHSVSHSQSVSECCEGSFQPSDSLSSSALEGREVEEAVSATFPLLRRHLANPVVLSVPAERFEGMVADLLLSKVSNIMSFSVSLSLSFVLSVDLSVSSVLFIELIVVMMLSQMATSPPDDLLERYFRSLATSLRRYSSSPDDVEAEAEDIVRATVTTSFDCCEMVLRALIAVPSGQPICGE